MTHLDLLRFLPFRLNRLAAEFSNALATDYKRFRIDVPEWRVLATLGKYDEPRSAQYVVMCTRTHKSRISRAVGHMVEMGLLEREENDANRRESMLSLTEEGRNLYLEIVPLLLARERQVLACLSTNERAELGRLLGKLETEFDLVQEFE